MDPPPLTIIDQKLHFLRIQIQNLSRPLTVPESFDARRPVDIDPSYILRQKSIDEALAAVNNQIRRHSKLVYPSQAVRHVAEQIDALYWRAGERDGESRRAGGGMMTGEVERGADLSTAQRIHSLPVTYPTRTSTTPLASNHPALQEQYSAQLKQLQESNKGREDLLAKVEVYKKLQELLRPFQDAVVNLQPNLVTRASEIEVELERMRTLVARVVGRMAGLEGASGSDEQQQQQHLAEGDIDEEEKVRRLVALC